MNKETLVPVSGEDSDPVDVEEKGPSELNPVDDTGSIDDKRSDVEKEGPSEFNPVDDTGSIDDK